MTRFRVVIYAMNERVDFCGQSMEIDKFDCEIQIVANGSIFLFLNNFLEEKMNAAYCRLFTNISL